MMPLARLERTRQAYKPEISVVGRSGATCLFDDEPLALRFKDRAEELKARRLSQHYPLGSYRIESLSYRCCCGGYWQMYKEAESVHHEKKAS